MAMNDETAAGACSVGSVGSAGPGLELAGWIARPPDSACWIRPPPDSACGTTVALALRVALIGTPAGTGAATAAPFAGDAVALALAALAMTLTLAALP